MLNGPHGSDPGQVWPSSRYGAIGFNEQVKWREILRCRKRQQLSVEFDLYGHGPLAIGGEAHFWLEVPEKPLLDFGRNRLEREVLEIGVEHDQRCSRGVCSPIRKPKRLPQPNGSATSSRIDHVRVVGIGQAPPVATGHAMAQGAAMTGQPRFVRPAARADN